MQSYRGDNMVHADFDDDDDDATSLDRVPQISPRIELRTVEAAFGGFYNSRGLLLSHKSSERNNLLLSHNIHIMVIDTITYWISMYLLLLSVSV